MTKHDKQTYAQNILLFVSTTFWTGSFEKQQIGKKNPPDFYMYSNDQFRYMYIKGLHDRDEIFDARLAVLEYIQSTGEGKFAANVPLQQGILDQRCGRGCVPYMEVTLLLCYYQQW